MLIQKMTHLLRVDPLMYGCMYLAEVEGLGAQQRELLTLEGIVHRRLMGFWMVRRFFITSLLQFGMQGQVLDWRN